MKTPNRASTSDSRKGKAQPDDDGRPQAQKFADLARELGCDEDEEAFKAKLREIAKSPPQHREKPKDKGA